jgi:chromosome partitioning protein
VKPLLTDLPEEYTKELSLPGQEKGDRMARIIAIANQKGGVGKTTTAINLGASIAAAGHRVLLVDMDPQGNASSGLGLKVHSITTSIYELLIGQAVIEDVIQPSPVHGLEVVPGTQRLSGLEVELVDQDRRSYFLREKLDPLAENYDFVIIDSPPSLGLLTVNVLTAAHSVLIPIQCEYYALEGLGQLLNVVTRIQQNQNPKLFIEGILLTMYDRRLNLSRQVSQEAILYFEDRVYRTTIPRNVKLSESPSFGKPILLYDLESSGAQSYIKLAQEVIHAEKGIGQRA